MMRDEMANLVWGIEKRVQGTSGEPLDRKFESNRLSTTQELRPPAGAVAGRRRRAAALPAADAGGRELDSVPAGEEGRRDAVQLVDPAAARRRDALLPGDARRVSTIRATPTTRRSSNGCARAPFVETRPEQGPPDNRLQGFMFHPRGSLLRLDPNAAVDRPTTCASRKKRCRATASSSSARSTTRATRAAAACSGSAAARPPAAAKGRAACASTWSAADGDDRRGQAAVHRRGGRSDAGLACGTAATTRSQRGASNSNAPAATSPRRAAASGRSPAVTVFRRSLQQAGVPQSQHRAAGACIAKFPMNPAL